MFSLSFKKYDQRIFMMTDGFKMIFNDCPPYAILANLRLLIFNLGL